ncbi:MAG: ELWxxDGT repeat protein, partial [Acidimicrobiales bacterium]
MTDTDPDGAKAEYGPATIFGGIVPAGTSTFPPSGPMNVSTQGTPLGGSVTSSAEITLYDPPNPAAPGGVGPGPLIADRAASTCTVTESGVSGSASITNGILETKYDTVSQEPIVIENIPANPPPNYTRSGTIDHVGDRYIIVFNEQIVGPDSITVNAAHMYLLGDIARGELIVASSTCSLTSNLPNPAPTATGDSYTTAEDTPLTVTGPGLLANDTDPLSDPLTATRAKVIRASGPSGLTYTFPSDPPNGTTTINADGSFTYTPDPDFNGTDTFTYLARDARGASSSATVTVTVSPVNDPPVAGEDTYETFVDEPLSVAAPGVLANDTDVDGDPLTASSASVPPNGSVALNSNGSFNYVPNAGFVGTDTFTYQVSDPNGGTATGTVNIIVATKNAQLLKDIAAGAGNSSPSRFVEVGGTAYFLTFSNTATNGLWKSDGTEAGTVLVKAINTGSSSSAPPLTVIGTDLYFQANDGSTGVELWKSDGTTAGTVLVKDILAGAGSSSPTNFRVVGATLYFAAGNGTTAPGVGTELWKSDGTTAGTVLVKDIRPGTTSSSPANLTAVGSTLYFSAIDGTTAPGVGTELWKSDGTTAGTVLVKDI